MSGLRQQPAAIDAQADAPPEGLRKRGLIEPRGEGWICRGVEVIDQIRLTRQPESHFRSKRILQLGTEELSGPAHGRPDAGDPVFCAPQAREIEGRTK